MSELMTTREASEYLKIGYLTLYKLAQQGEIPAYKVGSQWRFNKTALDSWFVGKSKPVGQDILIIGDDIDSATLSNMLISAGHTKVATVSNLNQALKELEKRTYSIVFLSATTTDTDCNKTIAEIRNRNYKSTIVAGLGPGDGPLALDAIASGPTFVIKKPFEEAGVMKMLDNTDIQVAAKTKDELIAALVAMRQRIDDFSIATNKRRDIEESLRLSEDKLRNFMGLSNDIFILVDEKLNIVEINASAAKYMPQGMDRDKLIGANILEMAPNIRDIMYNCYQEILRTNKPVEVDDIVIDSEHDIHMRARAFKVGKGFGIVVTDITDSKLLEALKASEAFNTALLDHAPNPMMVYEADTSIRYVNKAFEDLTGFSLQEVEGARIPYPWWEKDTIKKVLKTYKDPILPKPKKLEVRFNKKNGELFWVEVNAKTININEDDFYYIVSWVDVTERKDLELSLLEYKEKYKALIKERSREE